MTESTQGVANEVREFVESIVRACGFELNLEVSIDGENALAQLSGDDSEILLEDGARVLQAINDVVNQIFFRRTGLRVEIDCEDFRAMRKLELELLARKAAEKVKLTQQPYRLHPMPPGERRTIHMALAQESGVRTESQGNGDRRYVMIVSD